jgi:hypothetical protein
MKVLVTVFFLFISSTVFGQLNSYAESKDVIRMGFDMVFGMSDTAVFIVVGKEDYELTTFMSKSRSKLESLKVKALTEAGCEDCTVFEAKVMDSPINHVINEMEEGDVFVITKKEDLYLVELYRRTE